MKVLRLVAIAALAVSMTGCGFVNDFYRGQARADAENDVAIRNIQIQTTTQQVQIAHQEAQIEIEHAKGTAKAQSIINGSLTPLYVQHEAIQAQLEAAKNSSHTETIYVPVGSQGIPTVLNAAAK
jgi:hypothetical protein